MGTKRKTRVRNATEYLRATREVMGGLERTTFPFIVFHSENDTMCDCDGSKALFDRAKVRHRCNNPAWPCVRAYYR